MLRTTAAQNTDYVPQADKKQFEVTTPPGMDTTCSAGAIEVGSKGLLGTGTEEADAQHLFLTTKREALLSSKRICPLKGLQLAKPLILMRVGQVEMEVGHAGRYPAFLMAKMEISQGHLEVTT